MNSFDLLARQGHRLQQLGIIFFLFTSFEGFAVPHLPVPRLGLSVHTLSAFSGVFLLTLGLMWPRLNLSPTTSWTAFGLTIYSDVATVVAYLLAAVWGAGNSVMPLAAGAAHGAPFQEAAIHVVLYSAAPTGIVGFVLILWGLRIARLEAART
jgi:(hydroxyamino)benzene mutase